MLEKLVHGSGQMPPNQHFIKIAIPSGVTYEHLNVAHLPDWHMQTCASSRTYGDTWQHSKRSLLLIVPSVVAREELNILINPQHPEFPRVTTSLATPVWWDSRLFAP
jgi:RES domain-containing protein